jgi:hypothetical protein
MTEEDTNCSKDKKSTTDREERYCTCCRRKIPRCNKWGASLTNSDESHARKRYVQEEKIRHRGPIPLFPDNSSFSKYIIEKSSSKTNSYKCIIEGQNHLQRHFLVGTINSIGCIGHTCCSPREFVFKGNVEVDNEVMVD